jgi:hypothetical protein
MLARTQKSDQRAKLREPIYVDILTKAKRPSSSIFGLNDDHRSSLQYSVVSENSQRLSDIFSFDNEVMASTAYRNCFASLVRQNLHRRKPETPSGNDRASVVAIKQYSAEEVPAKPLVLPTVASTLALGDGKAASQTAKNPQDQSEVETLKPPDNALLVRAICDYEDNDPGHLSFHEGDIIRVIARFESGWWDGVLNHTRGWFPSNHCAFFQQHEYFKYLKSLPKPKEEDPSRSLDELGFWMPGISQGVAMVELAIPPGFKSGVR